MTGYSAIPQMPEALVVAVTNTDRNRDMPVPQSYGKGGLNLGNEFISQESQKIAFPDGRGDFEVVRCATG
ncbi:MAG TPA: hypothetical protein VMS31_18015 [Pyrinomonadaceae bacterium]|nr:hypothetical protein [Pyrinomonadaceae bacterium]